MIDIGLLITIDVILLLFSIGICFSVFHDYIKEEFKALKKQIAEAKK